MDLKKLGYLLAKTYIDLNSKQEFDAGVNQAIEEANKEGLLAGGVDEEDWIFVMDDKRDQLRLIAAAILALQTLDKK